MKFLNIILIVMLIIVSNVSLAEDNIPTGWFKSGSQPQDYIISIDSNIKYSGEQSLTIESVPGIAKAKPFVALGQKTIADNYKNQRIRMTAMIKTQNVEDAGNAWFRVESRSDDTRKTVAMDNMHNRPIIGSTDWTKYSLVLDIPYDATYIYYGAILSGNGKLWIDGISFEEVDFNTPSTATYASPLKPRNLDFENE